MGFGVKWLPWILHRIPCAANVIRKINNNEYKRRQAALGLKVTTRAFGSGRRFPIVQGYDFSVK